MRSRRPPWQRTTQFNPADYAPYDAPGTATITGQAFLKTRGGEVKFGAGNIVYLEPVTPFSTEWFEHTVMRGHRKPDPDERVHAYVRETRADGEGRFTYENLPAGEYYVVCTIRWQMNDGKYTGGVARAQVRVEEGQHVKNVIVSH